ncbi:glutamic-type intramembrane protease PrsW [Tumebacillus algifaecis]|uniref:glutamic-type intramembrane protease PrsW n=1 Tax=Tumebacillus algifaecis TaxID=1214604 RepID=UPI0012FD359F|nr:glutamic-type intramembrane protease PrsW [Tumebacillus algifaecis]
MEFLLLIGCAVAPGIALMSFFYLRDRYDSEPLSLVGLLFFLGMLSTIPVMYLSDWLAQGMSSPYGRAFFAVALVEELAKYILTILIALRHREFDEEIDGIVYAVAASLGFATLENIIKAMVLGWETVAIRAFFTVPGHALFGVAMGFYLGKAKFATSKKKRWLLFGGAFFYPWVFHGIYDSLLVSEQMAWIMLIIPFMIFLWGLGMWKVRHAQRRSPYKPMEEQVQDV